MQNKIENDGYFELIPCNSFSNKQQEHSISDENAAEASDVLSAISNEECSVTSEILDKNSSNSQSQSHIHAAEIIQVRN